MSFFRNREIKKFSLVLLMISAVFAAAGFMLSAISGLLISGACVVLCAAFYFFTRKRYKNIAALSERIDVILHGKDAFKINSFNEGELSVLQSEIQKMTLSLREQADISRKDKTYLADSIADIAHQLRTPMTSIRMIAAFLAKPELNEEERDGFIREVDGLLSRMDWLLSTLLKISKIDAGTAVFAKDKVAVAALLKKAAEPFEIPLELRGAELRVKCGKEPQFTGDINWTAEAVGNILKNCLEHLGENGLIEIDCAENAVFTEIIVRDNGTGIDKEDLPRIFERFYQGKRHKNDSYGIGLALCRMILAEQNATVKAANRDGRGACFTIRFYKQSV